jgi:Type II secretory pathway, component PulF
VPQYRYKGRNQRGAVVKGVAEADNIAQLKLNLRKNGLWVTQASVKTDIFQGFVKVSQTAISKAELVSFTKQVGVMLSSGILLVRALETSLDNASGQFRPVLLRIIAEIKAGRTYAQALSHFPRIFSPFYIGMIQIAEAGGLLGEMHQKILAYLEQGESIKGKILFAAIYPCIVIGVTVIGVGVILIYAFPKIAAVYKKNNVELPLITQILLTFSDFLSHRGIFLLLLILLILTAISVFHIHQKPPLRDWLNRITFQLPFYGKLIQQILLFRLSYNLALLLNSGAPLAKALEVIMTVMNNQVMNGYLAELLLFIKKGGAMADYFQQNDFFPPLFVSMIRTGEESGELVKMVNDASKYYETEVGNHLTRFIAVLEPALIIGAAGIVIIVLLAFYLPMFKMFQTIH